MLLSPERCCKRNRLNAWPVCQTYLLLTGWNMISISLYNTSDRLRFVHRYSYASPNWRIPGFSTLTAIDNWRCETRFVSCWRAGCGNMPWTGIYLRRKCRPRLDRPKKSVVKDMAAGVVGNGALNCWNPGFFSAFWCMFWSWWDYCLYLPVVLQPEIWHNGFGFWDVPIDSDLNHYLTSYPYMQFTCLPSIS